MGLEQRTTRTLTKGSPFPLGATLYADGVNFAIYSKHGTEVFLLLFDAPDGEPTDVIRLENCDRFVWHVRIKGLGAGQLYGYKVRGEYRPDWGLRFNDSKLLLDPYAKAVDKKFRNVDNLLLPYDARPGAGEQSLDTRDNAAVVPKGIVSEGIRGYRSATTFRMVSVVVKIPSIPDSTSLSKASSFKCRAEEFQFSG